MSFFDVSHIENISFIQRMNYFISFFLKTCNWLLNFVNEKFTSHSFCSEMGDIQINLEKPGEKTQDDGEVKGDLNIDPDLDRLV